jgi:hypothetical protein
VLEELRDDRHMVDLQRQEQLRALHAASPVRQPSSEIERRGYDDVFKRPMDVVRVRMRDEPASPKLRSPVKNIAVDLPASALAVSPTRGSMSPESGASNADVADVAISPERHKKLPRKMKKEKSLRMSGDDVESSSSAADARMNDATTSDSIASPTAPSQGLPSKVERTEKQPDLDLNKSSRLAFEFKSEDSSRANASLTVKKKSARRSGTPSRLMPAPARQQPTLSCHVPFDKQGSSAPSAVPHATGRPPLPSSRPRSTLAVGRGRVMQSDSSDRERETSDSEGVSSAYTPVLSRSFSPALPSMPFLPEAWARMSQVRVCVCVCVYYVHDYVTYVRLCAFEACVAR